MIRLKALELHGFKSFADRTRFEFHDGVTAIVGPNGSGKSNVVDAIKWVLGEQSVRSLRGREMADVIFAGTSSRRPLNAAETTLIFDNTAGELPAGGAEVRIGRRVYRSGESEYMIDGEVVRLRDIRELFSGTGATTEAYSVIEQGRVDALLVASGRERRAVFEEAAGITRFRVRRTEALRRLERAEQNRQRLADIVGEVAARLEIVLRQAARARRWRALNERLRHLRLAAADHDRAGVDAELAQLTSTLDRLATESRQTWQVVNDAEKDLESAETRSGVCERAFEDLEGRFAEAHRTLTAVEATLYQIRSRHRESEQDVVAAAERVAAKARDEFSTAAAVATADLSLDEAESRLARVVATLEAHEALARGSLVDADAAREELSRVREALAVGQARRLAATLEHERLVTALADATARAAESRCHFEQSLAMRSRLNESRATCEGNLESLDQRLQHQIQEAETIERAETRLSDAISTHWDELARVKALLEACRERQRVLEELARTHEAIPGTVQRVLAGETTALPRGLVGMLADLVTASAEIAPLVDIALDRLGPSLVIELMEDAVEWASREAAPSANTTESIRFVAISIAGSTIGIPAGADFEGLRGVVGRLDRLVSYDERHERVVRRALGSCWVVEQLDVAVRLLPAATDDITFVTLSGERLSPRGMLEIGGLGVTGLVTRQAERAALTDRVVELEAVVTQAERDIAELEEERLRARESIRAARSGIERAHGELATSRAELQRVIRDQAAQARQIELADAACREAERKAVRLADECNQAAEEKRLADQHERQVTDDLVTARRRIEVLDRSRSTALDDIRDFVKARDAAERQLSTARDERHRIAAASDAIRSALQDERTRLADARRRSGLLELEILRRQQDFSRAAIDVDHLARERVRLLSDRDAAISDKREATARGRSARERLASLDRELHAAELELGETKHRRERIVERIREDYGLDIDSASAHDRASEADAEPLPVDRQEMEREIEEIRRKLAGMTSVNLEALAEAEELEQRHTSLQAQLGDVTAAKASIEQLITRIDDESRRLLSETIETVRGHFRELFERLFAGGQADIVVDPHVDLLEASVEIVARPPGKEPRSISLLSGGEKTMTCVALLLAIFKSRPSPFCVLDEVDAALDEANVDRFTAVLRDFLSATQFIVVTHSKKTMAAATTLYGITMEESGVSKRVSVRFEQTAAVRAGRAA